MCRSIKDSPMTKRQGAHHQRLLFSSLLSGEMDRSTERELLLPSIITLNKKEKHKRRGKKETLYRADRVLANRTGKSRSDCFELLKQKRVWQEVVVVDDDDDTTDHEDSRNDNNDATAEKWSSSKASSKQFVLVPGPSSKLSMQAVLRVDRQVDVPLPPPLLLVYHKPKWVLSVVTDPYGRPCLDNTVLPESLHPVGRLDYDSSGLLLFSSSGPLTQQLLHPKHGIEKEYEAVVVGQVDTPTLYESLARGVETTEGVHTATLMDVRHWDTAQVAPYLETLRAGLPAHYNQTDLEQRGYLNVLLPEQTTALSTLRIVVAEGKHRMVRRVLYNCGHAVVTLKRQRIGEIQLSASPSAINDDDDDVKGEDELPPGKTRELTPTELAWVERLLKYPVSDSDTVSKKPKRLKYSNNFSKKAVDKSVTTDRATRSFGNKPQLLMFNNNNKKGHTATPNSVTRNTTKEPKHLTYKFNSNNKASNAATSNSGTRGTFKKPTNLMYNKYNNEGAAATTRTTTKNTQQYNKHSYKGASATNTNSVTRSTSKNLEQYNNKYKGANAGTPNSATRTTLNEPAHVKYNKDNYKGTNAATTDKATRRTSKNTKQYNKDNYHKGAANAATIDSATSKNTKQYNKNNDKGANAATTTDNATRSTSTNPKQYNKNNYKGSNAATTDSATRSTRKNTKQYNKDNYHKRANAATIDSATSKNTKQYNKNNYKGANAATTGSATTSKKSKHKVANAGN
jgi:23S rRNA pseudouridine2605 synthase